MSRVDALADFVDFCGYPVGPFGMVDGLPGKAEDSERVFGDTAFGVDFGAEGDEGVVGRGECGEAFSAGAEVESPGPRKRVFGGEAGESGFGCRARGIVQNR